MSTPSPSAIERVMSEAMQAIALIDDPEDQALLEATIEGQSDALEMIDRLVEMALADKALVEQARARAQRIESRAERTRAIILAMMEALALKRVERPIATLSVSHHAKASVTDPDALPDAFVRKAPDLVAIRKALTHGEEVAGAVLGNPSPRLTLRAA